MIPGRRYRFADLLEMGRRRAVPMSITFALAVLAGAGGWVVYVEPHTGAPRARSGNVNDPAPRSASTVAASAEAAEAVRLLEREAAGARAGLEDVSRRVSTYQEAHPSEVPEQWKAAMLELTQAQAAALSLSQALARDRERLSELDRLASTQATAAAARRAAAPAQDPPPLAAARLRLVDLERRLAPAHPDIQRLRREIQALEQTQPAREDSPGEAPTIVVPPSEPPGEREAVRARLEAGELRRRRLMQSIAALRTRIEAMPPDPGELDALVRERDAAERVATALEARVEAAKRDLAAAPRATVESRDGGLARTPAASTATMRAGMLAAGVLGALGLTFVLGLVLEARDQTIHDEDDLRAAAPVPLAGLVSEVAQPRRRDSAVSLLAWHTACPPRAREQYRHLAHALRRLKGERHLRVVAVTSAVPEEGKTLTTVNLAWALAEFPNQRILIVDGDLRRPRVGTLFDLPSSGDGLSAWLARADESECPIVRVTSSISVIPGYGTERDPVSLLTSMRMAVLLGTARTDFDWVLVDTPPAGLLSDAGALENALDGYLLVVAAHRTPYAAVRQAIAAVGREQVLGAVLNRLQAVRNGDGSEYLRYYAAPTSRGAA